MASILVYPQKRRSMRRNFRARCQAVSLEGFKLVGDRILDISTRGMLISCGRDVEIGEPLLVSFQAPQDGPWVDIEARVARLIRGQRRTDPGVCAGLRFVHIDRDLRGELLTRLAGTPPPLPRRPRPADYRATVQLIHDAG